MSSERAVRVGVIGASGFTGAELLRIIAGHPNFELTFATGASQAGTPIDQLYPSLAAQYRGQSFVDVAEADLDSVDLVFLGLPHGASQSLVPEIEDRVAHVVDLAADFRLDDPELYPEWYGEAHSAPTLLDEFVYGMPELFRDKIAGAHLVAAPGCYVTTSSLTLAPLISAGMIEPTGMIVDAASGVSGAGRPAKATTTFCSVDENMSAYGLINHRHTPEIEMALRMASGQETQLLFTPHLAPMNRGILATCYARPSGVISTDDALEAMHTAYADEPFVVVSERSPGTKDTLGSNSIHMTARVDPRTGWVVAIGALDNLTKGASGQAVQCANLALGLDETAGLSALGVYP